MKIAIFGAEGQLGSDLVRELAGHEVTALAHGDADVTDRSAVAAALNNIAADVVVNAAAMTHVDRCESDDVTAFQINALGARHVAEACREAGSVLVHVSTDYVFDGRKGRPYVEDDATHPLNVYGITKLAGELYVANALPQHYIVRSSGLYGTHRTRGKGRNFPETMMELAARGPLRVVGDEVLTPTFTEDLAVQIRRIIEEKPPHGVYHATNDGECSWFEFAGEILRLAGMDAKIERITSAEWNAPARRPAYSVLENAALGRAGIDAMPHWKDALGRYFSRRAGKEARKRN